MTNTCSTCGAGRLQKRNMVYVEWHNHKLLVVDRMPALVCDVCGDQTYDHHAIEHLQRLLWSAPPTTQRPAQSSTK